MPPKFRQAVKRLGISGVAFVLLFALFVVAYLAGNGGLAFLSALLLLPFACILLFRGLRFLKRHGLWSVRNRLLFVYGLIGVLPLCLVLVLIGLGAWAFTTELAIYLANTALDRRLAMVEYCTEALRHLDRAQQVQDAP